MQLVPGPPKQIDIEQVIANMGKDGLCSYQEPLSVRFDATEKSIGHFQAKYVLGASRAVASLAVAEAAAFITEEEQLGLQRQLQTLAAIRIIVEPGMDKENMVFASLSGILGL